MAKNRKLIITDEMIADSLEYGKTVTDVLADEYEGEIQDMVKESPALAGLDAFQLAMVDAGISKRSPVDEMMKTDGNEWMFPVFTDRRLRESVAATNILPYLVGSTETIAGNSIRGAKLVMDDKNKDAVTKKRVAEGTDIPLAKLELAGTAYSLFKRGRAVQATYEVLRRMSIDMYSKHLDMIANDVALQQVGDAIDVLVNGDGNANATSAITIAGADGLTIEEMVIFAIAFYKKANLPLTTIVTGDGEFYKKLMMMNFNANEINGVMAGMTFNFPQAQLSELNVVYDPRVPAAGGKEQLIGLNKDYALTKYLEAGSQIREYDQFIRNQTKLGTVTETAGFAKFSDDATLILKAK